VRPEAGKVEVVRWITQQQGNRSTPEIVAHLTGRLPFGVVVESTTLPNHEITISEHGFPLSGGRVVLRAPDGSRAIVNLGAES
jgi:hypothetical protein